MSELSRRGFLKSVAGLVALGAAPNVVAKASEAIAVSAPLVYENLSLIGGYDSMCDFVWARVSMSVGGDEYHRLYRQDLKEGDVAKVKLEELKKFAVEHMVGK